MLIVNFGWGCKSLRSTVAIQSNRTRRHAPAGQRAGCGHANCATRADALSSRPSAVRTVRSPRWRTTNPTRCRTNGSYSARRSMKPSAPLRGAEAVPRRGVRVGRSPIGVRGSGYISRSRKRAGRVDQLQPAHEVPVAHPTHRAPAVAAPVPQPARELRNRPDGTPHSHGGVAVGQHANRRAETPPSGAGQRLREGHKWRCRIRCGGGQNAVQSRTAASGQKQTWTPQVPRAVGVGRPLSSSGIHGQQKGVGVEGFEPPTSSL